MKRLFINLTAFSAPLVVIIIYAFILVNPTYEGFNNIDKVIFSRDKHLIGFLYNEDIYNYIKYKSLLVNARPNVLVLGSSRVLQFRAEMFTGRFYNAGYSVSIISDFERFMKTVPHKKYPDYLIIGLDQWMFNSNWDNCDKESEYKRWTENKYNNIENGITATNYFVKDLIDGKIHFRDLHTDGLSYIPVGLNAIINISGFRNDGSFLYGSQIKKLKEKDASATDYNFTDTYDRINKGRSRFQAGASINPKALKILSSFLEFCKNNKINVIGYLPPFADSVFKKMMESKNYNYILKLDNEIRPIFDKYNYEFYSMNTMSDCNSNDSEVLDGFHGGEKTYLKALIKILKSNSILNAICNLNKLESDLSNCTGNYIVYGY